MADADGAPETIHIFTVVSPVGYRVSLSRDRWRQITRFKRLNFLTPKQRAQGAGIPLEVQMV